MKTGIRAALANFGGAFTLVLLNGLLLLVGVFACFVGWIFVLPIAYASTWIAYRQAFYSEDELGPRPTGDRDADRPPDEGPELQANPPL